MFVIMKTEARVVLIQEEKGIVAAATNDDELTVFELLGCQEVKPGDVVEGYLQECGNQSLFNITREEELPVYIHEWGCFMGAAQERYFGQSEHMRRYLRFQATEEGVHHGEAP